jgi:transcriptional regulator with XRE-family HTH domain
VSASVNKADFGKRVKLARQALGMSQQELGEALNLTRAAVCLWEKGHSMPDHQHWQPLAQTLKVTEMFLLTGKGPQPRKLKISDEDKRKKTHFRFRGMIAEGDFDEVLFPRIEKLLQEKSSKLDALLRQYSYRKDDWD